MINTRIISKIGERETCVFEVGVSVIFFLIKFANNLTLKLYVFITMTKVII